MIADLCMRASPGAWSALGLGPPGLPLHNPRPTAPVELTDAPESCSASTGSAGRYLPPPAATAAAQRRGPAAGFTHATMLPLQGAGSGMKALILGTVAMLGLPSLLLLLYLLNVRTCLRGTGKQDVKDCAFAGAGAAACLCCCCWHSSQLLVLWMPSPRITYVGCCTICSSRAAQMDQSSTLHTSTAVPLSCCRWTCSICSSWSATSPLTSGPRSALACAWGCQSSAPPGEPVFAAEGW